MVVINLRSEKNWKKKKKKNFTKTFQQNCWKNLPFGEKTMTDNKKLSSSIMLKYITKVFNGKRPDS